MIEYLKSLRRRTSAVGSALFSLLLVGCGPLISFGGDGPGETYTLRYPAEPQISAAAEEGPIIQIDQPFFSDGLGGTGIKVNLDTNERATVGGVGWTADISDLLRDYLVLSLSDNTGVRTLGEGLLDVGSDCRLVTRVWRFELVPGASSTDDQVDVNMELFLIRIRNGSLLASKRFSSAAEVSGGSGKDIVDAFSSALRSLSGEQQQWLSEAANSCRQE